jgi:histidinol-phosphate aminotransferase
MTKIKNLLRKNILELTPYSSARDEYSGEDAIFIDANENPFNTGVNRYPDPLQLKLKEKISKIKNVPAGQIFLGNGSDEAIDLMMRAFCEPGIDNIVSIKPTYGMYKVCADINNIEFREALLTSNYELDKETILGLVDEKTKLMFLCSPNNPTSNSFNRADIIFLIKNFNGLVILDEAYIDFSKERSFINMLNDHSNLIIFQTLSKAWGMAGVRLGMAMASREIIEVLNRIKYPYNVNILTQRVALERLEKEDEKEIWVKAILEQRKYLNHKLREFPYVKGILPSDANFLMVKFDKPKDVFKFLMDHKIIVRDRSKVELCEGCLRITIGTSEENELLLKALKSYCS